MLETLTRYLSEVWCDTSSKQYFQSAQNLSVYVWREDWISPKHHFACTCHFAFWSREIYQQFFDQQFVFNHEALTTPELPTPLISLNFCRTNCQICFLKSNWNQVRFICLPVHHLTSGLCMYILFSFFTITSTYLPLSMHAASDLLGRWWLTTHMSAMCGDVPQSHRGMCLLLQQNCCPASRLIKSRRKALLATTSRERWAIACAHSVIQELNFLSKIVIINPAVIIFRGCYHYTKFSMTSSTNTDQNCFLSHSQSEVCFPSPPQYHSPSFPPLNIQPWETLSLLLYHTSWFHVLSEDQGSPHFFYFITWAAYVYV